MDQIEFKIGGLKRPSFNKMQRLILKVNKIPVIRDICVVKNMICKIYNMPITTEYNKDFFLSAPNVSIGENVGLADTLILAYANVKIGYGCSFSFRNMIITSTHDYNDFSTIIAKPVNIGNNVWVTSNVTILPGVTIGSNTVIGSGSVVTKDIPSGVFAAGNPCKVIKNIYFKK